MMRLLLASAILPICQVVADWSFTSSTLLVARYDPIMAAGTFDTHAHCFFGANVIERTFDAAKVAKSACTSIEVQANKSLYWLPLLFYQKRDGTFDGVEGWAEIHYRQRNHNDEKIVAFPPGIKMIGGTPFRRVYNASNEGDRAVSYQCLDYSRGDSAPTTVFPTRGCPDGMISSVWLPSCWDGKRLESPDLSHIAYPVGGPEHGKCPSSHPVRFINILVQAYWETQWFDYRKDALTWAFGDKTGLGFHADFINGWDTKVLQAAIDTCKSGLDSCAPFKASRDDALADSCRPVMPITDEDFGMGESIPQMPGDNPVWTSGLTKPSYGRKIPDPQTFLPSSPLASGFVRSGCVSSNALNGASYEDEDDMSGERCTAYCARKGFKLAGTRDGTACHCGNSFTSSNAGASVAISKCNVRCSGQYYENCGGERNLSLYTKVSSARKRHMKADASARH